MVLKMVHQLVQKIVRESKGPMIQSTFYPMPIGYDICIKTVYDSQWLLKKSLYEIALLYTNMARYEVRKKLWLTNTRSFKRLKLSSSISPFLTGLKRLFIVAVYIINTVNKTKLARHTSPPTQHHGFFRTLPHLFN